MKDLVVLVADKNAQFALKGALGRPEALGISHINVEFVVHPGRDGGARKSGPELLALKRSQFRHGLLIFDFEGSGTNLNDPLRLESEIDAKLINHWGEFAKSIVIHPELDIWMWGSDNALESAIRWPLLIKLREWLQQQDYALAENGKPLRPKEALEAALRHSKLPRSAALYENIAKVISLHRCGDSAFLRLRSQLQSWFPIGEQN